MSTFYNNQLVHRIIPPYSILCYLLWFPVLLLTSKIFFDYIIASFQHLSTSTSKKITKLNFYCKVSIVLSFLPLFSSFIFSLYRIKKNIFITIKYILLPQLSLISFISEIISRTNLVSL